MDWESIGRMIDENQARFPTMKLETKDGSKVIFKYPENGRQSDSDRASKHLKVDEIYTVKKISVGGSSSAVELIEVPGIAFNTVQFTNIKEEK
ncbi:hypothetical protein CSV75_04590 [Sporosarcina sp. P18a]|uniref:hypothetical protein n=1 Tax=Sporosarcina sp. P18a TaxID=2048259 RepID=UPI000C16D659|nr:hypothetical protein [Sporosarcina sp. P18a]PIC81061.1 hypothetical protein CSV75_04590 [Sporosarcina sp. P18a]